jgi:cell division septal protein FtsQ
MKARRTTGNRRKSGPSASRRHLLELNVRTASISRQRRARAAGFLWKVSAVVIFLALAAMGGRVFSRRFFFANTEYSLKHLVTNLHGVMTEEELVSVSGLKPGSNLFLLDLDEASRRLGALPEVRSVSIERRLPDTVEVGLERRLPLFLLASPAEGGGGEESLSESFIPGRSLLCDREGIVMRPARLSEEFLHLPLLAGLDLSDTAPGKRLQGGRFQDAVALADALSEIPEETFRVSSVDVSKPYSIVVTDSSGARFTFGTRDLPCQIGRLRKLLAHCQEAGRRIATANLMIQRNTPVTFVPTPEERPSKITPVTPSGKKSPRH